MTKQARADSGQAKSNTILSEITSLFTSVRTTITILFLLAAASVIGTLVPQDLRLEQIQSAWSPFWSRLVLILDLHTIYRSWWFILLLILLALNLLGCLFKRLPSIPGEWRIDARRNSFRLGFTDSRSPREIKELIVPSLSRLIGAKPREGETRESLSLIWTKHRVQLLGFPLIHVAIIVILLGGLMGLIYGVKGSVQIREGESKGSFRISSTGEIRPLPFDIAVDGFTLERYPTGEPKEYRSDVRLLKDGKELTRGSILVNHPLSFEGISLYQADYRLQGVKEARLATVDSAGHKSNLAVPPHVTVPLPDTPYQIRLLSLDPGTTARGEGVEIGVEAPGEEARVVRLFKSDPTPTKLGTKEVRFAGYVPLYVTGLQIGYDPGTRVVWIGCLLLVTGFLLALFTNHRGVCVDLQQMGDRTSVQISGRSKRARREFREAVENMIRERLGEQRDTQ